jgi:peptidoglycan/LPS O-acetylase OafA/YrhL
LGVYFFFVLSGFLITYLLITERARTGTVRVKQFYERRILRIWPLYYLLVLLGFFVFPHIQLLRLDWLQKYFADNYWLKFWFNIFMLPNLALAMFAAVPHIGQVWSIGVEEQFYILWPWLVKRSKVFVKTLGILFLAIVLMKCVVLLLADMYPQNYFIKSLKAFVAMSKIECMAIGAFGAYALFVNNKRLLEWVYTKPVQLLSLAMIPALIYLTPPAIQDGIHIVYSLLFIVIILNVSSNPFSLLKLENKYLVFLGSISYGMYMYHMFIVVLVIRIIHSCLGDLNAYLVNALYYIFALGLTIFVSWLSFRFFEQPFSKKRALFSSISSGPDTKTEA